VEVEPLSTQEATQFIKQLLEERGITIEEEAITQLLQKIEWYIPFHIQLTIQEIIDLTYSTKQADIHVIDQAFSKIIESRNNSHFEHYHSRLKTQFKGQEFKYAEKLLSELTTAGTITKATLYDMAIPYNLENNSRHIIGILEADGYINNNTTPDTYRFNSPVVRMWWQKYISI
jgi:hypothetical protein